MPLVPESDLTLVFSEIPPAPKHRRPARLRAKPLLLTEEQILAWVDAHYQRTGRWPNLESGRVADVLWETWGAVDQALKSGLRGLPGGSSLSRLLLHRRGIYRGLPLLSVAKVLAWADAHHERTGEWPIQESGPIAEAPRRTWCAIDLALRNGARGLPGGSSLAHLLAQERGVRNRKDLPPLREERILAWADDYHQRTGQWPTRESGPIPEALATVPGETWRHVDESLRHGRRALPGGDSLPRLLERARDVRNLMALPPLSRDQILAWADAFFAEHGRWPNRADGPLPGVQGGWRGVDAILRNGCRGLPGGSSLARLLARERGVRNRKDLPRLRHKQILAWAREHHQRTGRWPSQQSGPVGAAPGETWGAVNDALLNGLRGLPGGDSLPRLLARRLGIRNVTNLPRLTVAQVLRWADAHHKRTGCWPKSTTGAVTDAPGESWSAVNAALIRGRRGLPGGQSLAQLLERKRGVPNHLNRPPLTVKQILQWADEHHRRTGRWPRVLSGPIPGSGGETWQRVDNALYQGQRGQPGGDSLARLLRRHGRLPGGRSPRRRARRKGRRQS